MKTIREVSREVLLALIGGNVLIREKYHGTKVYVSVCQGIKKYMKKSGAQVTVVDLLLGDSYDCAISLLEPLELPDGEYRFTYDCTTGTLTNNDCLEFPGIVESKVVVSGKLNGDLLKMISARQNAKAFAKLGGHGLLDGFIIEGSGHKLLIPGPKIKPVKRKVSEEYYALMNYVVKEISKMNLLRPVPRSTDRWCVLLQIIDQIFTSTVNCQHDLFDLSAIDYGFDNVSVTPDRKLRFLSDEVREIIEGNKKLYSYYMFLLFLFLNKKSMDGNPSATDQVKNMYYEEYEAIYQACLDPIGKMGFQITGV
jgi:hypothetical protein